jgi:hypothetical protein
MHHPVGMAFAHPLVVERLLEIFTCHFRRAANFVTRLAASSAVNWTTRSLNIISTEAPRQNLPTASQPGRKLPTVPSVLQMGKKSVSTLTSVDQTSSAHMPTVENYTSVLSAVRSPTTPSPGSAGNALHGINSTPSLASPQILPYRNFSDTIVHRDSFTADAEFSDNIYFRIVHPYDIDAFEHFLSKHDLIYFYPLLVSNLRNGFPLGDMPPLIDTIIFKNHPSALLFSDVVDKYLTDELAAGRMSGPFSLPYTEKILRGAIMSSPLLVSIQIQQPGMPDKLRVCRHLSKGNKNTPSMNSHIQKEDFPTRFDTASRVADIVHSLPIYTQGFHIWWPYYLHVKISPKKNEMTQK